MPQGLFPDEAANGLDINLMQQGQLQPFYERGNGREALFFYLLWASVELFGKGFWQHHIVSALIGVLSVFACYLVTRRLMMIGKDLKSKIDWHKATNIALLASFLMAVSTWHVVLSRTAFRAILIPLFSALTFYFLLCTYQSETVKKRFVYALLSGVAFTLGFYTYIAYRMMVPILAILILWPFLASIKLGIFKEQIAKYWQSIIGFLAAGALFIYPLVKYFIDHPGSFVGRSGQVSVFNPNLNQGHLADTVWEVTKRSFLAFFTQGDINWRHNISGNPFLSYLVSPFFGAALVVVTLLAAWYLLAPVKRSFFWKYALLAGWFFGMLIPVVTTAEGIPHGLRSIGTIPAVFIISALGLYKFAEFVHWSHKRLWQKCTQPSFGKRLVDWGLGAVIMGFGLALILESYFYYFVYAANSPENFYAFRSDLTVVSKYLIDRCQKDQTYLILDKFSVQTPDYVTMVDGRNLDYPCNQPYRQVDPEDAWKLEDLKAGDEIIFTQSSLFDAKKFKAYHPQSYLALEYRNKFNQTVMAVYRINN